MNYLCNNCSICCRLIPLIKNNYIVRDGVHQLDNNDFESLRTLSLNDAQNINAEYVKNVHEIFPEAEFYSCKNLSETGTCISEEKLPFCKNFPSSPLAIIPEECSCSGLVFLMSEELKSKVRKIKEEILDYETLINNDPKNSKSYKKIADNLKRFVSKYSDFGSDNW